MSKEKLSEKDRQVAFRLAGRMSAYVSPFVKLMSEGAVRCTRINFEFEMPKGCSEEVLDLAAHVADEIICAEHPSDFKLSAIGLGKHCVSLEFES